MVTHTPITDFLNMKIRSFARVYHAACCVINRNKE